jgi:hypothetical protein
MIFARVKALGYATAILPEGVMPNTTALCPSVSSYLFAVTATPHAFQTGNSCLRLPVR